MDIVRAALVRTNGVYVANMDGLENTVEAREESMDLQRAGGSAAVTADEAACGLADAQRMLAGRGATSGIGFGFVKNFGSPRGLDGLRFEYAITDGDRIANVHTIISGTTLATLGYGRTVGEPDETLRTWALDRLYDLTRSMVADDRYIALLMQHPIHLG